MRMKLGILLTGAALMLVAFGCSVDNPTQPNTNQARLRPTAVLQVPGIGDLVWMDANHNGIQDDPAEEPGLSGVTVELLLCDDSSVVASTTTDTMGLYGFEDLTPGDYFLHFALPDGYAFSPMNAGDNDSLDSDADTLTGYTDCVAIDSGEVDLTWDAGMYPLPPPTVSVGDFVWNDVNMNGIQDSGEVGMAGIEVWIGSCPATDSTMFSQMTVTDSMGHYMFSDVLPGDYVLHFALPMGYAFSPMDQGDNDSLDSDVDPMTGYTMCFTVDVGMDDFSQDAGMYMATGGCTLSKGYWKNHAGFGPQADVVTDMLPIWLGDDGGDKSMAVTDAQIAVDILQQHTYGHPSNGITKLYAQLLAAKLNIANGAGMVDIADVISEADAFLAAHDWMDWGNLEMSQKHKVLGWKDMLDDYNNGYIGPGSCDDEGDWGDDDDDMGGDSVMINVAPGSVSPF
jgi:hypothetical protein